MACVDDEFRIGTRVVCTCQRDDAIAGSAEDIPFVALDRMELNIGTDWKFFDCLKNGAVRLEEINARRNMSADFATERAGIVSYKFPVLGFSFLRLPDECRCDGSADSLS